MLFFEGHPDKSGFFQSFNSQLPDFGSSPSSNGIHQKGIESQESSALGPREF